MLNDFMGDPESDPERENNLITMSTLGERIKAVRSNASQTEFAVKNGITQVTLSRYERNERVPDADFIATICKKYNISSEWLLFSVGPMRAGDVADPIETANIPDSSDTSEVLSCPRCSKVEARLDESERERRELTAEVRQLWKENSELREKCARLEERSLSHGENKVIGSAG